MATWVEFVRAKTSFGFVPHAQPPGILVDVAAFFAL
jgi:hypothetical protein